MLHVFSTNFKENVSRDCSFKKARDIKLTKLHA